MKKILAVLIGAALGTALSLPATAALNTYDLSTFNDLLLPTVTADTAGGVVSNAGTAVKISGYKGIGAIRIQIAANLVSNNYGAHVVIQDSANGSTLWTNISGLAKNVTGLTTNTAGETFKIELDKQKAYIRAVAVATNTAGTAFGATLITP